jgi:trehalose 2-sulfotransferase
VYAHHKLDHEFERTQTTLSYAVCALPRSGSSLLCELLFDTGLAGAPAEYFDAQQMARFCEQWGAHDFDAYLRALLERKTSPNGAFGFKAHFFQLAEAFPEGLRESAFPSLRYVHISRADRLRQAISWARAVQTGWWASDHERAQRVPVVFDRAQIDRLLVGIATRARRWEEFFDRTGAEPMRIEYEDLVAAPDATVLAVLRHIGVEVPEYLSIGPATLRRQADPVTEQWVQRYAIEAGAAVAPGGSAERW